MEISRILSHLTGKQPLQKQTVVEEVAEKLFKELLESQRTTHSDAPQKVQKPIQAPSLLELRQSPAFQQVYSKNGKMIEMAIFRNQIQSTLQEQSSGSLFSYWSQPASVQVELKWPADLMATLMQQSFQLIKEQLEREKRQKREDEPKRPPLPDGKSEEDALELLEILFDHVEQADSLEHFCDWAQESIQTAEQNLRERYATLPEAVELRFKIMHDAILALRNGIEPDYIKERLRQEIQRKKANQFP